MNRLLSPPSPEALLALARKYEVLARIRRDRDEGRGLAARSELRALAREFPGALRELDTLRRDEIDRRAGALVQAAGAAPVEPWMEWMIAYHGVMRAALDVKAQLARSGEWSPAVVHSVAAVASRRSGFSVDDDFVRAVASPPDGRLNVVVFQRLGPMFGVAPDTIWETLFPARRAGRY
ncbi:MAG TPA: hypothetical protein VF881_13270 [Polyangiaceae bacterium]